MSYQPVCSPSAIPFEQARWFTPTSGRARRLIVLHSMEAPEKPGTAAGTARYFQTLTRPASAHYCIDPESIIQCVQTKDVAYGAPGLNSYGVHLELAGYARQTRAEWSDAYSNAILMNAAWLAAIVLVPKFGIPVRFLKAADLTAQGAAAQGFTSHAEGTLAFHPGGHWDPGPGFPIDTFLSYVNGFLRHEF